MTEPNTRSQNSSKLQAEQPDRWLLYGLSFVSFLFMLGFSIALPSLPQTVESLGYSELDAGLVISIWALTYVAVGIPAGALLDRHNLKALIPITMAGNGITGLAFLFGASLPVFLIGRLVQGVLESFVWAGIYGLISFRFSHSRTSAFGILSGFSSLGFSVGPLLNSMFLASAPVRAGLVPFVVTSFASAALTALLLRSRRVYFVGEYRSPASITGTIRSLTPVAIVTIFMMIILGGFDAIVQAQNLDILASSQLSVALSGLLLSCYYISALVNRSLLTYTHRFVEHPFYPALSFLGALLVLLAGNMITQTSYTLALQWIVLGAILGVNWISFQALIAQTLGDRAPSTAMGIYSLSWGSGYLIMPPLVGLVAGLSKGPAALVFLEILVAIGFFSGMVFQTLRKRQRLS